MRPRRSCRTMRVMSIRKRNLKNPNSERIGLTRTMMTMGKAVQLLKKARAAVPAKQLLAKDVRVHHPLHGLQLRATESPSARPRAIARISASLPTRQCTTSTMSLASTRLLRQLAATRVTNGSAWRRTMIPGIDQKAAPAESRQRRKLRTIRWGAPMVMSELPVPSMLRSRRQPEKKTRRRRQRADYEGRLAHRRLTICWRPRSTKPQNRFYHEPLVGYVVRRGKRGEEKASVFLVRSIWLCSTNSA